MANVNITRVYLLNVPLENDYKNTLYFPSLASQQSYFQSRIVKSYTDFSYQRKDHIIRIPEEYDEIYNVNYVMYQNLAYSNKWFYAFITDLKYVNDGMTEATIETDVIQTWLFDYELKPSFVEREHVNDDTVGIHTVPEQLETGEYIVDNRISGRSFSTLNHIIVGATIDLADDTFPPINGSTINGIFNGLKYYDFYSGESLKARLEEVAQAGKSDGVVSIFMGCRDFFDVTAIEGKAFYEVNESLTVNTATWSVGGIGVDPILPPEKPTSLNGYTPRNKKLLTFPYCYLMASNNNGSNAVYKYELFSSNNCDFRFIGSITPGMSIRLQPLNYNNQPINNEEGLNIGKLPICSWNTDVYTNWLTQNSVNIGLSVASGMSQIVVGTAMSLGAVATGGVTGIIGASTIAGGVGEIAGTLGQIYQQSLTPPQAEGNINNGDVTFSSGNNRIDMYQMTIKQEYARIIDKYFDMFGYKVNMVKLPNSNHRSRWWYTKTIDVNIDGAIPQDHMQLIKNAYNNGITFWKNPSEIQNYNLTNEIV